MLETIIIVVIIIIMTSLHTILPFQQAFSKWSFNIILIILYNLWLKNTNFD